MVPGKIAEIVIVIHLFLSFYSILTNRDSYTLTDGENNNDERKDAGCNQ